MVRQSEFLAVYEEWSSGRLTQAMASARLGVCDRTFRRYVAQFRAHGCRWWRNRSSRRRSSRRATDSELASLESLYRDRYPGWSVRHFYERYRREHGGTRSYSWVKNGLQAAGLVEKRTRDVGANGRTRKNEWQPTGRKPREGMVLHQIGSHQEWAPGQTWDLILIVDDATSRVHSGSFVEERGIWPIFRGIRETLTTEGLFDCLNLGLALPSRLTALETRFGGRPRPQLARAMSELDIEMCLPDPRKRMRNARLFGTLLGRLPQELAARRIAEIERANSFLTRVWSEVNETLAVHAREPSSAFEPLAPMFRTELREVLCLKHQVRTQYRGRWSCQGKELEIPRRARRQLPSSRGELRIHEYEDGSCALFAGRERVTAVELDGTR